MRKVLLLFIFVPFFFSSLSFGQTPVNKFQPFTYEWPAGNDLRTASGAPGPKYWQQRADYSIEVTLDEEHRRITGSETVTYHNNSPHTLNYLWVQLDQNKRAHHSHAELIQPASSYDLSDFFSEDEPQIEGGMNIESLTDSKGAALSYHIVETNMRIDVPGGLNPGERFVFQVSWSYNLNNARIEGRSGFESFGNSEQQIFEIAQFYPRMCVYDDVKGWQNKPFLGPAEFALEFGNFHVAITVPADHLVSATGELQNSKEVLSHDQIERLAEVYAMEGGVKYIVTPEEAELNAGRGTKKSSTWIFEARNVRDFAFASSRMFVWDAGVLDLNGREVLVQSFYPNAAMPLWNRYATHAAMHTLRVYSRMTIDYPYPVCNVVNGPVWGMEYPMVAFCGGRPGQDGEYSSYAKYAMISVVMHEVGHNFFPMVINNDERRWAWMDEGLNSFCQFITEQEFEPNYPSRRGFPEKIAGYMSGSDQDPIMTNPESIRQNGRTSYEKTAVGLNMLRETIMGREVFDMAFKEFAKRWAWKHPEPWDFFRTMEDASGVDLDWFWRTWFYSTEPVDISVSLPERVTEGEYSAREPFSGTSINLTQLRNETDIREFYIDGKPELIDEHTANGEVSENPATSGYENIVASFLKMQEGVTDESGEKPTGDQSIKISLENKGGAPMPVTLQIFFADGTHTFEYLPAQIWIKNNTEFLKKIKSEKRIVAIIADPLKELPDTDRQNNFLFIR